ncbi:GmrSD restriction endonuclease domain-containing protein [Neptunomonas qingdaonensis]|uniref:GmrSD restriction endonucleases N-terminal domain-containing protein n=1 Tax=Neptunomonas qingdaonensis TaxID=1045558 RepID=A0A1I2NEW0_9GAMM|nr:DUF262 domain-containing protein [Neptunomonas qingdaonensis]SFG01389.1 Protein of unknown function DUF262 [Neptunomonas qingdaonensis]
MSLLDEVNEKRKEIRTDGYAMSISEWGSLYESKEIDIHPEFQRFYRWSDTQKTNLIESILLGIPIPPVFVSQRKDGIWDVVDGLQRLSTIYQFMGILKDENSNNVEPLTLSATNYLPSLGGKKWNNPDDENNSFSQELRLIIKRSKINVSIVLKESDETAKYDLFQRLNTGGSDLSPQEVRNCILVMLNKEFYNWLQSLASYPSFQECIALSERPLKESYDLELALRFLIFSDIDAEQLEKLGDVGIFITEKMRNIAINDDFDKVSWEALFKKTFDLLRDNLSDESFKRYSTDKQKFSGGFLLSQYEVVAYGVGYNLKNGNPVIDLRRKAAGIWSDQRYTDWSGSGITATRRLPRILPFGREVFDGNN